MSMEYDADTVSAPRLVVMKRGEGGYGFNLHGERNIQAGQSISAVDDGSEAQKAGLRVGDKVIEVNGMNIENMSHGDVVKRIKMNVTEVSMLVCDHITEAYLKQEGRPITADMANLMTVYQNKQVESEPVPSEPPQPVVVEEEPEPEVEESNTVETAPTITDESSTNEVDSAEVANEATTPEEVKQLNEVLEKEEESLPAPTTNGTVNHSEVEPAPEPAPEPARPQPTPVVPTPVVPPPTAQHASTQRPTSKPLRSTIKQQKTESWDDKYKKFQNLWFPFIDTALMEQEFCSRYGKWRRTLQLKDGYQCGDVCILDLS